MKKEYITVNFFDVDYVGYEELCVTNFIKSVVFEITGLSNVKIVNKIQKLTEESELSFSEFKIENDPRSRINVSKKRFKSLVDYLNFSERDSVCYTCKYWKLLTGKCEKDQTYGYIKALTCPNWEEISKIQNSVENFFKKPH